MPLNLRNTIAVLATIVILLGVFFTVALYYPTSKLAKRMARSRAVLEAQIEAASLPNREPRREKAIAEAMTMDVNFFKKRDLPPGKGIPDLLEQINRMGSQMSIQFLAVKPLEEEEGPGYRQYPFLIETKAAYRELVNFVDRVENWLRLSLGDLRIEADKKSPEMHRLQFTLNIYELDGDLPNETSPDSRPIVPDNDSALVTVHRDPFSAKKKIQIAEAPPEKKTTKKTVRKPKPIQLVLMGIMEVAGNKRAIINNQVLRQGEIIRGQRINEIADDHVILGEDGRTYSLYLKGASAVEKREGKK